jgi:hypothetical protein
MINVLTKIGICMHKIIISTLDKLEQNHENGFQISSSIFKVYIGLM